MKKIRDINYSFLSITNTNKRYKKHNEILIFLITLLKKYYSKINYDHIKTLKIFKDESINLYLDGKKYDIAFKDNDYIVYIEIKVRKWQRDF